MGHLLLNELQISCFESSLQRNFVESMAGYSLVCYLLQVSSSLFGFLTFFVCDFKLSFMLQVWYLGEFSYHMKKFPAVPIY